jgi:tRNA (guanine37-N1)-methyltransferase
MKFTVMTLFPEMIIDGLHTSILGKAIDKKIIELSAVNIRDYTLDKHRHVDDYPYGGGAGMVMSAEPIYRCFKSITGDNPSKKRVVYLTPQGRTFNQSMAKEFAKEDEIIFLCGHYEGVDERILEEIVTDNVSIGDYVLSGGELPVMVMIDAISRMVPGVLTNEESGESESFEGNLLEYPQYTRPTVWNGKEVPEVLLSGHHANIEKWRREQSLKRTLENRPDLLEKAELTKKDRQFLASIKE